LGLFYVVMGFLLLPVLELETLLIATAGGLITAALLVGAVSLVQSGKPGTFALATIATADITDAAIALDGRSDALPQMMPANARCRSRS